MIEIVLTIAVIILIALALLILYRLIFCPKTVRQTPGMFLELIIDHLKIKGINMATIAKPNQNASGEVKPQDRHGNPSQVQENSVQYESDNTDVCTVEKDTENEKKFKLNFLSVGFANVKVKADADLGEGVVPIEATLQVVVEPEQAVGFGLDVSEP